MLDAENHVARLLFVAQALGNQSNTTPLQALAQVVGVQPKNPEFYRLVAEVYALVGRARAQVAELKEGANRTTYLGVIDAMTQVLTTMDPTAQWNDYRNQKFDTRPLTLLETCANVVEEQLQGGGSHQEELDDALESVRQALRDVLEADVEPDTKELLAELLQEVERAIVSYRISGLPGLRRAVERSVGAMVVHAPTLARQAGNPAVANAVVALQRAWTVLGVVGNVQTAAQIATTVAGLLGM
jgi:hypothetical protein